MVAFRVGVGMSAGTSRSLQINGALFVAHGITLVAWLGFPMTSRADMVKDTVATNDVGHIALTAITIVLIVSELASGAVALGRSFRVYSLVSGLVVVVFGSVTGVFAAKVNSGEATPWMGATERVSIGAWLLWIAVFALQLLRRQRDSRRHLTTTPAQEDRR
jgi:hypothetical protein